jgi:hypothetical protein
MTEPRALTGPEIVERVAASLLDQREKLLAFIYTKPIGWDMAPAHWRAELTDDAKAAISALLDAISEPSETMLDAGLCCADDDDATTAIRNIWSAMRVALKREVAG